MNAFRWRSGLLAVGAVIAITACKEKAAATVEPSQEQRLAQQAVARTRESIREVSDVYVKQVALDNSLKNDPTITEAIRQYESLSPEDRVRFVVNDKVVKPPSPPPEGEPTHPKGGMPFVSARDLDPAAFDLAVRKADIYVKQIRLTNELFNDADTALLSAVEAWDKMTPDQRRKFSATPEATAYYWRYVYQTYKLQLLRQYLLYTRECYWGYKTPAAIDTRASISDKQFDLKQGSVQ